MTAKKQYEPVVIKDKIGFGAMSLTLSNPKPIDQGIEVLKYGIEKTKFINGSEFYNRPDRPFENLELLQAFVAGNDDESNRELVISLKGCMDMLTLTPLGSRQGVAQSVADSTRFFPLDPAKRPKLVFELARVDPNVPYEDSISYVAEYVKQGKLDGISLSEVGAQSIAKAADVFPISFVEAEFSIVTQDILYNGVMKECSQCQIPIVAYSPLGIGLLTSYTAENADTFLSLIEKGSYRTHFDRFKPENFESSIGLIKSLYEFAVKKGTTLEGLALSWIMAISERSEYAGIKNIPKIIPIPSFSSKERVDQSFNHLIELTESDLKLIKEITEAHPIKWKRFGHPQAEALLNG